MKKLFLFVFTLGIICLGFYCVNFTNSKETALAASYTQEEIISKIANQECTDKAGIIYLTGGASYTMDGGEIRNHFADKGGAIYVGAGSTFTMNAGTISGNYGLYGGAIYVEDGGKCYINGGTISGNYAQFEPAIYAEEGATLVVSDNAVIENNNFVKILSEINIYVDGNLSKTMIERGSAFQIEEADMPLDYESCCGYFLDDIYMTTIKNNTIDLTQGDVNLYTKTATAAENFTFEYNGDNNSYELLYLQLYDGDIVVPQEYEGVQVGKILDAFRYGCDYTGITLPSGITAMEDSFFCCCGVEYINIPDTVITIGANTFDCCDGLTTLIIPNSVETIGNYAFSYVNLESLTLPNSLKNIGLAAFSGWSNLTEVTIPSSVINISAAPFTSCVGLTSLCVEEGNTVYDSRNNCNAIIETDTMNLVQGCHATDMDKVGGITRIGNYAFNGYSSLTEIIIPETVTSIGNNAFSSCSGLTSIEIPDSVISLGSFAFYSCTGLTSVSISKNIKSIEQYTFQSCAKLTSVTIPDSVETIGTYAFVSCKELTSINMSKNVTSISGGAFTYCSKLTKVNITDIDAWAQIEFADSSSNPLYYAKYLYLNNKKVTNVVLSNNVTRIGKYVFYNCVGLESIYIPDSVTTITASAYGYSPFYNCSSTTVLYCEATEKPDGWGDFFNYYSKTGKLKVYWGCKLGEDGEILVPTNINIYVDGELSKTLTYYNQETYTVNEADMPLQYENCCGYFLNEELTETIKNGTIDLTQGDVNLYTKTATAAENFSFTLNETTNTYDIKATSSTLTGDIILPKEYDNTPISLASKVFEVCYLKPSNLTLSDSITELTSNAFWCYYGLRSITLPDSITKISSSSLGYCYNVSSIVIPKSVTSLSASSFTNCYGLTSIVVDDKNTVYDSRNDCNAIIETVSNKLVYGCQNTVIPNNVVTIGSSAFYMCSKLTGITIPTSVVAIESQAFTYSGLISIEIPSSVISLASNTFTNCASLATIIVDEANSIYDSRENCNAIIKTATDTLVIGCKTSVIPDDVVCIGDSAFYGCSGLTSIEIPSSVTKIVRSAFYNCSKLASLTFNTGLLTIDSQAFSNCKALTEVVLPAGLISIGATAFAYCTSLTSVTIPASVTTITGSAYYNSPFYNSASTAVLYCKVPSRPAGWGSYFNYYSQTGQLETVWEKYSVNVYVDGELSKTITPEGTTYTVLETDMPLEYESCCGYFLNEELTITIKNNTIDLSQGSVNIYTKTATDISIYDFTLNEEDDVYEMLWMNGNVEGDIVLPQEYNNKPTTLGEACYYYGCDITSVTLPAGITELKDSVFNCCCSMETILIPDSVTTMGIELFSGCSALTSIVIPSTVASLGHMFGNCLSLTSVVVEEGNTVYDSRNGCNAIIETATGKLVAGCVVTDLSKATNITSIGRRAFSNQNSLTSIVIPEGVTDIEESAFIMCSKLTSITLPESLTSIDEQAFRYCSALTSIRIPASVTNISASRASVSPFYSCSSTMIIYCDVASKPTGWGDFFNYYSSTKKLTVVWAGTPINFYVDGVLSKTFNVDSDTYVVDEADMPLNYDSCCGYFLDEILMTTIKDGEIDLTNGAVNLYTKTATYLGDYIYYDSYEGVCYISGATVSGDIVIPKTFEGDPVTYIADLAFEENWGITSITFPDCLTSIGESAFYYCNNDQFTNLVIPDCVRTISAMAFSCCEHLSNVIIGDGLSTLGSNAFFNCSDFTSIYLPASLLYINAANSSSSPFRSCWQRLAIYCGASSKPSGWGSYWNYQGNAYLENHFGYTREAYEAATGAVASFMQTSSTFVSEIAENAAAIGNVKAVIKDDDYDYLLMPAGIKTED